MNPKTSLQKSLFPRFLLRAISLFTVIVFLATSFPPQAFADNRPQTTGQGIGLQAPVSSFLSDFVIPSELGKIDEINFETKDQRPETTDSLSPRERDGVRGKSLRSPVSGLQSKNRAGGFVVLIQDAHSIPDAQRSLEKLIEYLHGKYGVTTVAVEGAEGKLDPTLFRMFPDAEKRGTVFSDYLASGELSGVAAASVLLSGQAAFVGIEDWKLYQEGVAAFLAGLAKQPDLKSEISDLKGELQKLKEKYYSAEALEFDAKVTAWRADPSKLADFLSFVSKYYVPGTKIPSGYQVFRDGSSEREPSLADITIGSTNGVHGTSSMVLGPLFETLEQEKRKDPKLDREIKSFAATVEAQLKDKTRFNQIKQAFQTGRMSPGEFAYEIRELTGKGTVPLKHLKGRSPSLQTLISNHEKLAKLKGPAFMKELDSFLAEVRAKLLMTSEAESIAALDGRLGLIGKLVSFELSRAEWEELRRYGVRGTAYGVKIEKNPDIVRSDLQLFRKNLQAVHVTPLVDGFLRFYQISILREAVFIRNIGKLLRTPYAVRGAAVVTGGFHTSGLAAKLKAQGIPYVVISPAIKDIPKDNRYIDHMQGKVSWQKYFRPKDGRIDLYDAFSRATVDRLSGATRNAQRATNSELTTRDSQLLPTTYDLPHTALKEWRDGIIRTLASEGRVAEHRQYTRYIDQQIAGNSGEFLKLKESWTAKLEKFIDKLQSLGKSGQLSEANVAKLLGSPAEGEARPFRAAANQTPYAVNMVPGMSVPVSFTDGGLEMLRAEMRTTSGGSSETDLPEFRHPWIGEHRGAPVTFESLLQYFVKLSEDQAGQELRVWTEEGVQVRDVKAKLYVKEGKVVAIPGLYDYDKKTGKMIERDARDIEARFGLKAVTYGYLQTHGLIEAVVDPDQPVEIRVRSVEGHGRKLYLPMDLTVVLKKNGSRAAYFGHLSKKEIPGSEKGDLFLQGRHWVFKGAGTYTASTGWVDTAAIVGKNTLRELLANTLGASAETLKNLLSEDSPQNVDKLEIRAVYHEFEAAGQTYSIERHGEQEYRIFRKERLEAAPSPGIYWGLFYQPGVEAFYGMVEKWSEKVAYDLQELYLRNGEQPGEITLSLLELTDDLCVAISVALGGLRGVALVESRDDPEELSAEDKAFLREHFRTPGAATSFFYKAGRITRGLLRSGLVYGFDSMQVLKDWDLLTVSQNDFGDLHYVAAGKKGEVQREHVVRNVLNALFEILKVLDRSFSRKLLITYVRALFMNKLYDPSALEAFETLELKADSWLQAGLWASVIYDQWHKHEPYRNLGAEKELWKLHDMLYAAKAYGKKLNDETVGLLAEEIEKKIRSGRVQGEMLRKITRGLFQVRYELAEYYAEGGQIDRVKFIMGELGDYGAYPALDGSDQERIALRLSALRQRLERSDEKFKEFCARTQPAGRPIFGGPNEKRAVLKELAEIGKATFKTLDRDFISKAPLLVSWGDQGDFLKHGVCFFIGQDSGYFYALTAGHVAGEENLGSRRFGVEIGDKFAAADVLAMEVEWGASLSHSKDFAVFRIRKKDLLDQGVTPHLFQLASPDEENQRQVPVGGFGYSAPRIFQERQKAIGFGLARESNPMSNKIEILNAFADGFSGSPVIALSTGKVLGIVLDGEDNPDSRVYYALSARAIRKWASHQYKKHPVLKSLLDGALPRETSSQSPEIGRSEMRANETSLDVVFKDPKHMHVGPSAVFVMFAMHLRMLRGIDVEIQKQESEKVPANDTMAVLALEIHNGDTVRIFARGPYPETVLGSVLKKIGQLLQDEESLENGTGPGAARFNDVYAGWVMDDSYWSSPVAQDVQRAEARVSESDLVKWDSTLKVLDPGEAPEGREAEKKFFQFESDLRSILRSLDLLASFSKETVWGQTKKINLDGTSDQKIEKVSWERWVAHDIHNLATAMFGNMSMYEVFKNGVLLRIVLTQWEPIEEALSSHGQIAEALRGSGVHTPVNVPRPGAGATEEAALSRPSQDQYFLFKVMFEPANAEENREIYIREIGQAQKFVDSIDAYLRSLREDHERKFGPLPTAKEAAEAYETLISGPAQRSEMRQGEEGAAEIVPDYPALQEEVQQLLARGAALPQYLSVMDFLRQLFSERLRDPRTYMTPYFIVFPDHSDVDAFVSTVSKAYELYVMLTLTGRGNIPVIPILHGSRSEIDPLIPSILEKVFGVAIGPEILKSLPFTEEAGAVKDLPGEPQLVQVDSSGYRTWQTVDHHMPVEGTDPGPGSIIERGASAAFMISQQYLGSGLPLDVMIAWLTLYSVLSDTVFFTENMIGSNIHQDVIKLILPVIQRSLEDLPEIIADFKQEMCDISRETPVTMLRDKKYDYVGKEAVVSQRFFDDKEKFLDLVPGIVREMTARLPGEGKKMWIFIGTDVETRTSYVFTVVSPGMANPQTIHRIFEAGGEGGFWHEGTWIVMRPEILRKNVMENTAAALQEALRRGDVLPTDDFVVPVPEPFTTARGIVRYAQDHRREKSWANVVYRQYRPDHRAAYLAALKQLLVHADSNIRDGAAWICAKPEWIGPIDIPATRGWEDRSLLTALRYEGFSDEEFFKQWNVWYQGFSAKAAPDAKELLHAELLGIFNSKSSSHTTEKRRAANLISRYLQPGQDPGVRAESRAGSPWEAMDAIRSQTVRTIAAAFRQGALPLLESYGVKRAEIRAALARITVAVKEFIMRIVGAFKTVFLGPADPPAIDPAVRERVTRALMDAFPFEEDANLGKIIKLSPVWNSLDKVERDALVVMIDERNPTRDPADKRFMQYQRKLYGRLSRGPNEIFLLVDPSGRITGHGCVEVDLFRGNIYDLWTYPKGERRGTFLMSQMLSWLREIGLKEAAWASDIDAMAFYHKFLAPRMDYSVNQKHVFSAFLDTWGRLLDENQKAQKDYLLRVKEREADVHEVLDRINFEGGHFMIRNTAGAYGEADLQIDPQKKGGVKWGLVGGRGRYWRLGYFKPAREDMTLRDRIAAELIFVKGTALYEVAKQKTTSILAPSPIIPKKSVTGRSEVRQAEPAASDVSRTEMLDPLEIFKTPESRSFRIVDRSIVQLGLGITAQKNFCGFKLGTDQPVAVLNIRALPRTVILRGDIYKREKGRILERTSKPEGSGILKLSLLKDYSFVAGTAEALNQEDWTQMIRVVVREIDPVVGAVELEISGPAGGRRELGNADSLRKYIDDKNVSGERDPRLFGLILKEGEQIRSELRKEEAVQEQIDFSREFKKRLVEAGRQLSHWYQKRFDKFLREIPKFRMIVYLVFQLHLPWPHTAAYLLLGTLFVVSGPIFEAFKVAVVPASALLAEISPVFWVVPPILMLWLGAFLRMVFFIVPFWGVSKARRSLFRTPLRISKLIQYNFIPFAGAYAAAIAQLWFLMRERYRELPKVSLKTLLKVNDLVDGVLQPGSTGFLPEDRSDLSFLSPEITLLILEFQKKYERGQKLKIRITDIDEGKLSEKVSEKEKKPRIFFGSLDEYEVLRKRIRQIVEGNARKEVLRETNERWELKLRKKLKTEVFREVDKWARQSGVKDKGELQQQYRHRMNRRVQEQREQRISLIRDRIIDDLPFYRMEAEKYLSLRRADGKVSYKNLGRLLPESVIVPLFDVKRNEVPQALYDEGLRDACQRYFAALDLSTRMHQRPEIQSTDREILFRVRDAEKDGAMRFRAAWETFVTDAADPDGMLIIIDSLLSDPRPFVQVAGAEGLQKLLPEDEDLSRVIKLLKKKLRSLASKEVLRRTEEELVGLTDLKIRSDFDRMGLYALAPMIVEAVDDLQRVYPKVLREFTFSPQAFGDLQSVRQLLRRYKAERTSGVVGDYRSGWVYAINRAMAAVWRFFQRGAMKPARPETHSAAAGDSDVMPAKGGESARSEFRTRTLEATTRTGGEKAPGETKILSSRELTESEQTDPVNGSSRKQQVRSESRSEDAAMRKVSPGEVRGAEGVKKDAGTAPAAPAVVTKDWRAEFPVSDSEVRDSDGLGVYVRQLLKKINDSAPESAEVLLSEVADDPEKYAESFFRPLIEIFLTRISEDFRNAEPFTKYCRRILSEEGVPGLQREMQNGSPALEGLLKGIESSDKTRKASIEFYGLLLSFLTKNIEYCFGRFYDLILPKKPDLALGRDGFSYHTRAESTLRLHDKGIAFGSDEAIKKYKEGRDTLMDRKPGLNLEIKPEWRDKILRALELWKRKARESEDIAMLERISRFETSSVVIVFESDVPLVVTDADRNVGRVLHSEREINAFNFSSKFLDSLELDNDEDMKEMAVWLNAGQRWLDRYDSVRRGAPGLDTNDMFHVVEAARIKINNQFFENEDSGLLDRDVLKQRFADRMKRQVIRRYTNLMQSVIKSYETMEQLMKKAEAEQTSNGKALGYWAAFNQCRMLLLTHEAMGMHTYTRYVFQRMTDALTGLQLYEPDEGNVFGQQCVLVLAALRLGRWKDFINELGILLSGRSVRIPEIKDIYNAEGRRGGLPVPVTAAYFRQLRNPKEARPGKLERIFKRAMHAQFLATKPELYDRVRGHVEDVNRLFEDFYDSPAIKGINQENGSEANGPGQRSEARAGKSVDSQQGAFQRLENPSQMLLPLGGKDVAADTLKIMPPPVYEAVLRRSEMRTKSGSSHSARPTAVSDVNPYILPRNVLTGFVAEDLQFEGLISRTLDDYLMSRVRPRVLILGAGGGEVVREFKEQYGDSADLSFINKEPIRIAIRNYRAQVPLAGPVVAVAEFTRYFHRNVTIHDLENGLGLYRTGSFHVVLLTRQTWRYLRRRAELLQEIKRVLVPGGRGFISQMDYTVFQLPDGEGTVTLPANEFLKQLAGAVGGEYKLYNANGTKPALVIANLHPERPFPELKAVRVRPFQAYASPEGQDRKMPVPISYEVTYRAVLPLLNKIRTARSEARIAAFFGIDLEARRTAVIDEHDGLYPAVKQAQTAGELAQNGLIVVNRDWHADLGVPDVAPPKNGSAADHEAYRRRYLSARFENGINLGAVNFFHALGADGSLGTLIWVVPDEELASGVDLERSPLTDYLRDGNVHLYAFRNPEDGETYLFKDRAEGLTKGYSFVGEMPSFELYMVTEDYLPSLMAKLLEEKASGEIGKRLVNSVDLDAFSAFEELEPAGQGLSKRTLTGLDRRYLEKVRANLKDPRLHTVESFFAVARSSSQTSQEVLREWGRVAAISATDQHLAIRRSDELTPEETTKLARMLVKRGIAVSTKYLDDEAHADEVGGEYIARMGRAEEGKGFLTAFWNGDPVGLISFALTLAADGRTKRANLEGEVWVAPENQGVGIGRRLFEDAKTYLASLGAMQLSLVIAGTEDAQAFWPKVIPVEYLAKDSRGLYFMADVPLTGEKAVRRSEARNQDRRALGLSEPVMTEFRDWAKRSQEALASARQALEALAGSDLKSRDSAAAEFLRRYAIFKQMGWDEIVRNKFLPEEATLAIQHLLKNDFVNIQLIVKDEQRVRNSNWEALIEMENVRAHPNYEGFAEVFGHLEGFFEKFQMFRDIVIIPVNTYGRFLPDLELSQKSPARAEARSAETAVPSVAELPVRSETEKQRKVHALTVGEIDAELKRMPYYNEMLAGYFARCPRVRYEPWLNFIRGFFDGFVSEDSEIQPIPVENTVLIEKAKRDVAALSEAAVREEALRKVKKWQSRLSDERANLDLSHEEVLHDYLWFVIEDQSLDRFGFLVGGAEFRQKLAHYPEPNEWGYHIIRTILVAMRYLILLSSDAATKGPAPVPSSVRSASTPNESIRLRQKPDASVRSEARESENEKRTPAGESAGEADWKQVYLFSGTHQISPDFYTRYSRYKYGARSQIESFSADLVGAIRGSHKEALQARAGDWVLVTPPYSTAKPSIFAVGEEVAKTLGIPHLSLRAKPLQDPNTFFTHLNTAEARQAAVHAAAPYFEGNATVAGKNVLFIDDLINTGATVREATAVLEDHYQAKDVHVFSIVRLKTDNLMLEEVMSSYLLTDGNWDALLEILNQPGIEIVQQTVKSIFNNLDQGTFEMLAGRLSLETLGKLLEAANARFHGQYHGQKIRFLEEEIGRRSQRAEMREGQKQPPAVELPDRSAGLGIRDMENMERISTLPGEAVLHPLTPEMEAEAADEVKLSPEARALWKGTLVPVWGKTFTPALLKELHNYNEALVARIGVRSAAFNVASEPFNAYIRIRDILIDSILNRVKLEAPALWNEKGADVEKYVERRDGDWHRRTPEEAARMADIALEITLVAEMAWAEATLIGQMGGSRVNTNPFLEPFSNDLMPFAREAYPAQRAASFAMAREFIAGWPSKEPSLKERLIEKQVMMPEEAAKLTFSVRPDSEIPADVVWQGTHFDMKYSVYRRLMKRGNARGFLQALIDAKRSPASQLPVRAEARIQSHPKPIQPRRLDLVPGVYEGVVRGVAQSRPVTAETVRDFTTELGSVGVGPVTQRLWDAFNNVLLPEAMAAMTTSETSVQAAVYQSVDDVLRKKDLTREMLDKIADQMFAQSLKDLAEAITKNEVGGMAPVVFYSPEMKARLLQFIETVQLGFEATGDVTGSSYRITLVSSNKAELMKFKAELSKRGMLRGLQFVGDKGPSSVVDELSSSVIRHPVFGGKFGVFFPENDLGQNVAWQRVVRTEIPSEYAVLLLPVLSRYFATVSTSDINATTLRQALPDLFASARFRFGQGIAIVAAFLETLAVAQRQVSIAA